MVHLSQLENQSWYVIFSWRPLSPSGLTLGLYNSVSFDKCLMSWIRPCSIRSNSFALKIPCALPIPAPTFSIPDTDFYCLIYIDIIPIMHLKTLTKLPRSWDTFPVQVSGLSNKIPRIPLLGIHTEIMFLVLNSPSLKIKVSHLPDDLCLTLFSG